MRDFEGDIPKLVAIGGATASGKTELGVEIALALNGEVISADSMQVYRGMDIGTAKPTMEERRGVPHHLLDVVDPSEERLKSEFADVKRTYIPLQAVIRIDEVARGGTNKIISGDGSAPNIAPFPTPRPHPRDQRD